MNISAQILTGQENYKHLNTGAYKEKVMYSLTNK